MPANFPLHRAQVRETIDLTGDSDDEPVSGVRPPRASGQAGSDAHRRSTHVSNAPKSTSSGKGTPSTRSNGRAEIEDLSPAPSKGKATTSKSPNVNGTNAIQHYSDSFRSSQSLNNRKPAERSQTTSYIKDNSQRRSSNATSEPIILTDDGQEEPSPQFKVPRGLDMTKPRSPSRFSSSFDSSKGPLKRSRDEDSQSSNSQPSKRPRVRQSFTDDHSTPGANDLSQANSEHKDSSRQSLLIKGLSQRSTARNVSGREPIDLVSPPQKTKDSRSSDLRNSNDPASQDEQQSSKRARKRTLASDPIEHDRSPFHDQRDSQKPNATTFPQQAETPHKEPNNDDDTQSSHSGGSVNRRDTTPRIRKETAKAQEISASKKAKSQNTKNSQSPSSHPQANESRAADRSKPNRSANEGSQTSVLSKSTGDVGSNEAKNVAPKNQNGVSLQENHSKSGNPKHRASSSRPANESTVAAVSSKEPRRVEASSSDPEGPTDVKKRQAMRAQEKQPPVPDSEPGSTVNGGPSEADTTPSRAARRSHKEIATTAKSPAPRQKSPKGSTTSKSADDVISSGEPSGNGTVIKDSTMLADEADMQLRSEAMKSDDQTTTTNESKNSFAVPKLAASAMRPPSSYSKGLPLGAQVEKVLGKYLEELGDDNEYWTSILMSRARLAKERVPSLGSVKDSTSHGSQDEQPTSFANLRQHVFSQYQKGNTWIKSDQLWGIERMSSTGRGTGPTWLSNTYRQFASDVPDVPNYAHYVSIKNNILAPNVTKLICWPYFGDDFDCNTADNLKEQYHLDIDSRERKLILVLKAQKYEDYVQSALEDLECSWADVLRFLLEPHPDVGSSPDAIKALNSRHEFCEHDFSRISERWQSILAELPPSTPEKLARAAVLCDNFQKLAKFSVWHVARRSEFARLPEEESVSPGKAQPSENELTCRICLRFNCPYHGELKEQPDNESDSDDESGSAVDSVVATDIVHPPRMNYRTRVAIPPQYAVSEDTHASAAAKNDRKDPRFWRKDDFNQSADDRGPFYPCHHPGTSCVDAQCSCFENRSPCEKICSCAPDCQRKFQGCSCSTERYKKGNRGPCFEDERCACFQSGRECDPDLCGGCGACEVVDPINKYDDGILIGRCRNCSIQRGVPKQTLLGDSGVHGLGLYACEEIRENDFVGEYKGEIITKEEAERRGAVYEIQKLSYLFSLNATQEIDSTNFGNKVRFINHAKGKANLYPRIIMVNTVHRIALYASCTIRPGQELFFDYGPKFPDEQLGGKKSKKSAPHVRNAELVRNFLEVEESEDEVGNMRAKGVTQARRARNKSRNKKPRGGARANAGRKPRVRKQYDETASTATFTEQDAGERLAAFNISDEVRSDLMDVDGEPGADADDDYELDEASESSYDSQPSERSESEVEDEDEDDLPQETGRSGRGGGATRRRR